MDKITSTYIHNLQYIYHKISNRGIRIDVEKIEKAKIYCNQEIADKCEIASKQWNCKVFVGAANDPGKSIDAVNLNATQGPRQLLKRLQDLGYEIPKIAKRAEDGTYESKYSTSELALQKMLVRNQFNYQGGDPAIRAILQVRELGKLQSGYFNALFYSSRYDGNSYYLANYNCAGTLSGRRSSKKHTYGFGNNGQNFPKHGKSSGLFREALISRPNNILLMVDQKSAEEWPVNALAANYSAISEMRAGVNRHIKRASRLFDIPISAKTEREWKADIAYFLGKKFGHGNNYGMGASRLSDSLAQEGYSMPVAIAKQMLAKINLLEPEIDAVFHKYIKDELYRCRVLKTPFGRERQFLGLRPKDANSKILNEAYSYIPQSVVGDNTGFAVSFMESISSLSLSDRLIVQEGHDSIVFDIPDNVDSIFNTLTEVEKAFNRTIRFYNGIEVEIPIEAEIGYNFNKTIKIKDNSYDEVVNAKVLLDS